MDLHLTGLDLGDIKNIVDDLQQGISRVAHHAQHLALLDVEFRQPEQLHQTKNRVHRCADLMTHGGEEHALGAVCLVCRNPGFA